MKKISRFQVMALSAAVVLASVATVRSDDTVLPGRKTTTTRTTTTQKFKMTQSLKAATVDRVLEVRIGPRITFLSGEVRLGSGSPGDRVDIFDDLQLDDASPGLAFDLDWQVRDRWHVAFGMTYDDYDQTSGTGRNITAAVGGDILQQGASVNVKGDIYTFEVKLAYDLIKNNYYRLQPFIGGKALVFDGVTATISGTTIDPAGLSRQETVSISEDLSHATFFVGLDQRFYFSRSWYFGAELGGFTLEDYGFIAGDAYTGYDFNKNFGVRLGYDANYVTYENSSGTTQVNGLLGAAYIQAVVGY
jgi:hypothetical protein